MNRLQTSSLLLPCLALLAGCGGSSSFTRAANPYAGVYTGTYSVSRMIDSGTFDPTVSSAGVVTGTTHSNGTGADGVLSGTLSSTGDFVGSVKYADSDASPLKGRFTLGSDGVATGTLVQTFGSESVDVAVTITKSVD